MQEGNVVQEMGIESYSQILVTAEMNDVYPNLANFINEYENQIEMKQV